MFRKRKRRTSIKPYRAGRFAGYRQGSPGAGGPEAGAPEAGGPEAGSPETGSPGTGSLTRSLEDNIALFRNIFQQDDTLTLRELDVPGFGKACLVMIDGMTDSDVVNDNIIQPVLMSGRVPVREPEDVGQPKVGEQLKAGGQPEVRGQLEVGGQLAVGGPPEGSRLPEDFKEGRAAWFQKCIIAAKAVSRSSDVSSLCQAVIDGDTVWLLENEPEGLIIDSKGWKTRAIDEPKTETVVMGPREGFNESLIMNLTLIRRRIKTPNLKFEFMLIGRRSRTRVCICYLKEIAKESNLRELRNRLEKIDIDGILSSSYLRELIMDSPYTPFDLTGTTERPDIVSANLLEGRLAVLVDGSPCAMMVPFLFVEYFQANDDYYTNFYFGSLNRILRILGFLFTISIPGLYLSLVTFHHEMVPSSLLMSIYAARQGLPFPTVIELIVMLLLFEILRESGTRLPAFMGQALSIVGALVIGQAAVEARLVSAPTVIVSATAGITELVIPRIKFPSIMIRVLLLLMSSLLGLYGFLFGLIGLLLHLVELRSFGVPYLQGIMSFKKQDLKDTVFRGPWWTMRTRPRNIAREGEWVRQQKGSGGTGK
ncbi:MAG TPA: spore germination protein [Clostridiales bacterium]|nr:spore germination protein [Clostridiales bacterium]